MAYSYADAVKKVKGPSPTKRQKASPPLGPDDFNLEAVVGKGGFGQVNISLAEIRLND